MVESSREIRRAFFQALNGALTYDGKTIPVYDNFSDEGEGKYQVFLTNQDATNADDKQQFAGDHSIVIDIVTKANNSGNSSIADEISEQVSQILQPTRKTTGLIIGAGFQLILLQLSSSRYLTEGNRGTFIVRKLLTYRFRIVHN